MVAWVPSAQVMVFVPLPLSATLQDTPLPGAEDSGTWVHSPDTQAHNVWVSLAYATMPATAFKQGIGVQSVPWHDHNPSGDRTNAVVPADFESHLGNPPAVFAVSSTA